MDAGSTVEDSTLIAPITCAPTRTGTQASATSPGMAAMKSGVCDTSWRICGTPVTTTRPITPMPGVNPSTTW